MNIEKSKYTGFCSGVRVAVVKATNILEEEKVLYSLGEIIHNKDVVDVLEKKGLVVVDDIDVLDSNEINTTNTRDIKLLIRSHGVGKDILSKLREKNLKFVDATCVKVKKIHQIVENYSKDGYNIIIIGDSTHPEVIGIIGWCDGNYYTADDVTSFSKLNINKSEKYCLVCQTTFNTNIFKEIVEFVKEKRYTNIVMNNTICDATRKRQEACVELASKCDVMLIVGGKNSSNTKKLYELSKKVCDNTFYIENYKEIPYNYIDKYTKVGVSAGASTPDWIIEEVIQNVRKSEYNN